MTFDLYGAEWCSACKAAKSAIEAKGFAVNYIDIDEDGGESLNERLGSVARGIPVAFCEDKIFRSLKEIQEHLKNA